MPKKTVISGLFEGSSGLFEGSSGLFEGSTILSRVRTAGLPTRESVSARKELEVALSTFDTIPVGCRRWSRGAIGCACLRWVA
jgi:hypothetical protein